MAGDHVGIYLAPAARVDRVREDVAHRRIEHGRKVEGGQIDDNQIGLLASFERADLVPRAECGAVSGMAAVALVTLAKARVGQAIAAASMALQAILGMTCDPVANRVEVPRLGKNVLAASNALACANMALADYDPVIPPDEVIETMDRVGKSLPRELRCTALGGLAVTKTSGEIAKRLAQTGHRGS